MALSFVGFGSAAANLVALPAFNVGDLAIVSAYRDGSNTPPSLPTGWTNIASSGANTNASRVGYRVLVGTDVSTNTWTNATEIEVLVLRGQRATSPIGGSAAGGASSNQISYPAVTLTDTGGTSWVAGFAGHRTATDVNSKAVTGMTTRSGSITSIGAHTAQGVSSFSSSNYTTTVNATSGWRSYAVEVRAAVETVTGTARISLATGQVPVTRTQHSVVIRARKTALTGRLRVFLYEGATLRSSLDTGELTTSLADYTLAIADVDAAAIVSYSDLELRLQGYSSAGAATVFEVAAVRMALPLPAAGTHFGATVLPLAISAVTSGTVGASGSKQTLVARLSLGPGATPGVRTGHSIIVRARKTNGAHTGEIMVHLFEGSNPRSVLTSTGALTTSFANYTVNIAEADAAGITSYADLEVRLRGVSSTGTSTVFEIARVELVLPDTGTGGNLTGQVVLSSITTVTVGAEIPIYPGTGIFPRNQASFTAVATITAVWGGAEAFGLVDLPSTATIQVAGANPPTNHTGLVLLASTATVAAAAISTDRIGAVVLDSVASIAVGGTSVQDAVGAVVITATATVTAAGLDSSAVLPAGTFDIPFADMPDLIVAIAFASSPRDTFQQYSTVAPYIRGINAQRGRQFELDRVEAGKEDFVLDNNDGRFSPENTSSPYYPNLIPTRRVRWAMVWSSVTYDLFNGFLEGYPQEFPHVGHDSLVRQSAVDAFMTLATAKLIPGSTVLTTDMNVTTEDREGVIGVENVNLPMPQAVPFTIRIDDETMTVAQVYGPEHDQYEPIPGLIGYRVARLSGSPIHTAGAVITTTVVSFGEEYSGQRVQNVLSSVGLSPLDWAIDHGQSLLGPSDDLGGQTPLEHCLAVAEWEGGRFFSARGGKATFLERHSVFQNEKTARATFGDGGGTEIPYQDVQVTHEDERIYNIIRITPSSGNVKEARDEQSITDHFERVLEKEWPLADDNEAQAAVEYLLYRYSRMQVRIPSVTLAGRRNPSVMWPHLLGAEIGQHYRFIRRPANDATIDKQLIVEGITHELEPANMFTTLQMSLADTRLYWQLEVAGSSELNDTTRLIY